VSKKRQLPMVEMFIRYLDSLDDEFDNIEDKESVVISELEQFPDSTPIIKVLERLRELAHRREPAGNIKKTVQPNHAGGMSVADAPTGYLHHNLEHIKTLVEEALLLLASVERDDTGSVVTKNCKNCLSYRNRKFRRKRRVVKIYSDKNCRCCRKLRRIM